MGNTFLERDQLELMRQIPTEAIPHGTDIPVRHFQTLVDSTGFSPIFMELGAGDGRKASELREQLHALVLARDVNPQAVETANQMGIFAEVSDARGTEIGAWDWYSRYFYECFTVVYAEGLLCNQRGDDWEAVLREAELYTTPTGRIFIADVCRPEEENPLFRGAFPDEDAYISYIDLWERRLEANRIVAEQLGIPFTYGEFMVAKPGPHKTEQDWGHPDTLAKLYSSDEFERWAQHLDSAKVIAHAKSIGLTTVVNEPDVFYSRMGFPLNGRVFGFEKGPRFKVHPVFKGMTHEERKRMSGVI